MKFNDDPRIGIALSAVSLVLSSMALAMSIYSMLTGA